MLYQLQFVNHTKNQKTHYMDGQIIIMVLVKCLGIMGGIG